MRDEGQMKPQSQNKYMDPWRLGPVASDNQNKDTIKGPVHPIYLFKKSFKKQHILSSLALLKQI